jgi:Tir chaperone protein (CesT) family
MSLERMSLEGLLSSLSAQSGLNLSLDANGSCALEYGPGFELTLTSIDAGNGLLLHQPLQFLSPTAPEAQLRRCMELNLYGTETAGAILGLDPQSNWIVLAERIAVDMLDVRRLEEAILRFMAVAGRVAQSLSVEPQMSDASPMPADGTSIIRA